MQGVGFGQLLKLFAINSTSVRRIFTLAVKNIYETNLKITHHRTCLEIFMKLDIMRSDSEIIALAWDDKASFEMIEVQTGLSEKGIIKLMRRSLKPGSFRKWRERVSGRPAKHAKRSLNALSIDYADLQ